jgi:phage tail-like protein
VVTQNGWKTMPPSAGASSNESGDGSVRIPTPYITAKFWVEISSIAEAFFQECSGLQLQTDVFEYAEGGLNGYTHKLPGRTKVGNVTLKRGLVQSDALWNWYSDVIRGVMKRRTITILVYDNKVQAQSSPAVGWVLQDALPVKWVGPTFKAGENAVAVDQLEFIYGALDGSGALSREISPKETRS